MPFPAPDMPMAPGSPGGPAPMNANPFGMPRPRPQPPQPPQQLMQNRPGWEDELMRAHGFGAGGGRGRNNATFLGVSVTPLPDSLRGRLQLPAGIGMVVASVEPGSPAQQAGIQPNDVLHKIDDQLLVNAEQLAALVRTFKPGREVRVSLVRGGKPTQLNVRLGQRDLPPLSDVTGAPGSRGKPAPHPMTPPQPGIKARPGMPPGAWAQPQGAPGFDGSQMYAPLPPGPTPKGVPPTPFYAPLPVQPAPAQPPMPPATPAAQRAVAPIAPVAPVAPVGPVAPVRAVAPVLVVAPVTPLVPAESAAPAVVAAPAAPSSAQP